MRTLLLTTLLVLTPFARAEERIVTSEGRHTAKDGKISVQVTATDTTRILFEVAWEAERAGRDGGKIATTWRQGSNEPFPVVAGKWAFCLVGKDELWFYDGEGTFHRYKGTPDGIDLWCGDPNVSKSAPEILKTWIAQNRRSGR